MWKLGLSLIIVAGYLSFFLWDYPTEILGQSQPSVSSLPKASSNSVVAVSSSLTVPITNQTVKTNEASLKLAIVSFLGSGPNVLKTSDNVQFVTKTKIDNKINNATQSVEGIEATNAIVGVEIGKALRSLVGAKSNQGNTVFITVTTSSSCKSSVTAGVFCDNSVVIK